MTPCSPKPPVDGSEIYHWFIAYPHLRVETGKTESIWCETELEYVELKSSGQGPDATLTPSSDYRLRLHKDGTQVTLDDPSPPPHSMYAALLTYLIST